jgi:hypothetical protein
VEKTLRIDKSNMKCQKPSQSKLPTQIIQFLFGYRCGKRGKSFLAQTFASSFFLYFWDKKCVRPAAASLAKDNLLYQQTFEQETPAAAAAAACSHTLLLT